MAWQMEDESIFILAPVGRDGPLLQAMLMQAELSSTVYQSSAGLQIDLEEAVGALLLTEEALTPACFQQLQESLAAQPEWSNVPVILLVDEGARPQMRRTISERLGPDKNVIILERPIAPKTLIEIVQATLWVRRRQYQVRDLLTQLALQNQSLRQEVTERQQTEAALRSSEEKFAKVFHASPLAITITRLADSRFIEVNETFVHITGYKREEVLGRTLVEVGLWVESAQRTAGLLQLQAGDAMRNTEVRFRMKDGNERICLSSAELLEINGQTCVVTVVTDITERKQVEAALYELNTTLEQQVTARTAELERSNHELVRFAYVASHDLKAPLRAIDHLASWISQDAADVLPAASQLHLTKLHARIQRMNQLLDDLLAYSRVGRVHHRLEVVDTAALVRRLIDLLAPPSGFTVHLAEGLPTLITERVSLELVLRNLIGNAIKHHDHPQTGQVTVSATVHERVIEFSVTDDGPGVDPKFHERIFQMFQTLQPRDQVEGSGMGLAIVKKLVESRGGTIGLVSSPDRGATFSFTWPSEVSSPQHPSAPRVRIFGS